MTFLGSVPWYTLHDQKRGEIIIIIIIIIIILQLRFHSVVVVLTLVQIKQIRKYINEIIQKHSTNNTKHSKYKYTFYQNTHTYTRPHVTKQV